MATVKGASGTGSRGMYSGSSTGFVPTSSPTALKLDISDVIDAIDPRDIPLLAVLGFGAEAGPAAGADSLRFPCIQPQHSWLNDNLIPSISLVVSSTGGPPVTTVNVTTGEGNFFNADDIIMIENGHYTITSISTDALTVVALDSTTPAAPAVGATIYILGQASNDGALATSFQESSTVTTQTNNFTQIFFDVVRVGGSWEATEQYGIDNPFDRETDKKIKEVVIKLERDAHYGRRTTAMPTTNADPARRMGGLWYYIRSTLAGTSESGSQPTVFNAGGGAMAESRLLDALQNVWALGGKPDTIWVGARQKRAINNFLVPFVRTERTDSVAGVVVGRYESDFGDVKVVLDRYMKPDDLLITTNEYLGIGPLKGNGKSRAFSIEKLPRRGDLDESQIIGEYTMEVRNNTRAHAWIYNLATS